MTDAKKSSHKGIPHQNCKATELLNELNKTKKDRKSAKWFFYSKLFGSLLLFGSWIFDNYYHKNYEGARSDQDFMRINAAAAGNLSDLFEHEINVYEYFYKTDSSDQGVKGALVHALELYAKNTNNQKGFAAQILSLDEPNYDKDWKQKQIDTVKRFEEIIDSLVKIQDITSLRKIRNKQHQYQSAELVNDIRIANEYREKLTEKENGSNLGFLILYMLGSLLIAGPEVVKFYRKDKVESE